MHVYRGVPRLAPPAHWLDHWRSERHRGHHRKSFLSGLRMFKLIVSRLGGVLTLSCLLVFASGRLDAAQRFDGVWIVKQNNEQCRWTPPPYQVRIANGRVVGLSGTVSASGEIRWSVINKDGNTAVFTGRLRGDTGSGRLMVISTHCQGTFTMRRRR